MTTRTRTRAAQSVLDLDARLALAGAVMTGRLDEAAVAFEVNTAHLPATDHTPYITHTPQPTPTRSPYRTPIADLLHRARMRIIADGWCRDSLFDEQGAVCPIRAIRLEAHGNRRLADEACVLLLDRIQAEFPHAETIPSWNAQQTSHAPVLLAFDRAAHHAHTHNR